MPVGMCFPVTIGGVTAIIATMTPNRSDNLVIDNICRFINLLAMNIGKSKNRSE